MKLSAPLNLYIASMVHLLLASPHLNQASAWIIPPSHHSRTSLHYLQPNVLTNTETTSITPPKQQLDLRILLIDNHDSYTYNLYQYLSTMTVYPVKVVMNDEFASWDALLRDVSDGDDAAAATTLDYFDCIIISPGPGRPSHPSDMGIVLDAIKKNADVPILGVCLGHQALGYVYGCDVTLAPCGPVHGLMSSVFYDGEISPLFEGIPQYFDVVRYHSLVVQFPVLKELDVEPIAWCSDEVSSVADETKGRIDNLQTLLTNSTSAICMGLRHKKYPHYGVQFHPESIGTAENGYNLLWNFCELAYQHNQQSQSKLGMRSIEHSSHDTNGHPFLKSSFAPTNGIPKASEAVDHIGSTVASLPEENADEMSSNDDSSKSSYQIIIHKIESDGQSSLPTPEQVFEEIYSSHHNSFWLDSSTAETNSVGLMRDREGCPIISNSRFSIMGSDDGPLSRKIEYFGQEHSPEQRGLCVTSGNVTEVLDTNILAYLQTNLVKQKLKRVKFAAFSMNSNGHEVTTLNELDEADDAIPFDYRGGYVGYLGYEVRYDCLDDGCRGNHCTVFQPEKTNPQVPSAAFLFADRSLLYDHLLDNWYAIGVARDENCNDSAIEADTEATLSWIRNISAKVRSYSQHQAISDIGAHTKKNEVHQPAEVQFTPNRSKEQYLKDVTLSHDEIRKGESYELCVTNQLTAELKLPRLSTDIHESPFGLYKRLRRRNPAPFSAFFNLHPTELSTNLQQYSGQVSICCSSPERFLSMRKSNNFSGVNDFVVESKPIKGTAARYTGPKSDNKSQQQFIEKVDSEIAARLKESVKDKAENLMIVDLLRNDLGRVCRVGSVHVPKLMHIESYATVHQMVSTVRGIVDGSTTNAIDVIEACFPGGSMTGAPKHRTVEILDEIEQGVSRGPYSGCLGYISLNGCMDMNIIIRTAVFTPSESCDPLHEAWKVSIGCGGAITALSDSNDEYEEMLLKSRAVRESIVEWAQTRQQ